MDTPHCDAAFARACLSPDALPPPGLTAAYGDAVARRFAIHRNTVRVTLIEALAVAFPVVKTLVGEDFFAAAAATFVTREPPRSAVLAHYGRGFADFLAGFPPAAALPYLPDMARLERRLIEAYHAADAMPARRADLAAVPPEAAAELVIARHPATRWLRSPWPVVTLWRMNTGRLPLAPLTAWSGEDALVTRPALDVELTLLPATGDALLARLDAPQTLGVLAAPCAATLNLPTVDLPTVDLPLVDLPVVDLPTVLPALLDAGALRLCPPEGDLP